MLFMNLFINAIWTSEISESFGVEALGIRALRGRQLLPTAGGTWPRRSHGGLQRAPNAPALQLRFICPGGR